MPTNYGYGFTPANQDYKNPNPVWYPGMVLPGIGEMKANGSISPITSDQSTAATSAQYQGLEGLTNFVNSLDVGNQLKANQNRYEGAGANESLNTANTTNLAKGIIDPGVLYTMAQGAAERGTGTGSPTGPSTNASYMKDLGLTAYAMQKEADQRLTNAANRNPAAPITPAGGLYQTMEQQKLAEKQLAQQLKIAEMNDATQRATAAMGGGRGGGGGGFSTPSITPNTPFPNLFPDEPPYVNPDATGTSSSTGSAENRWMPLPSDPYFDLGSGWTPQPTPTPSFGTLFPDNNWSDLGSGYNPSAFGTNTGYSSGGYNDWSLGDIPLW